MAKKKTVLEKMDSVIAAGKLLDIYRSSNRMKKNNPKEIREDPGSKKKKVKAPVGKGGR
jgi:hypothetical protein